MKVEQNIFEKQNQSMNKGNGMGVAGDYRVYILPLDGSSISTVFRDSYGSRGKWVCWSPSVMANCVFQFSNNIECFKSLCNLENICFN